MDLLPRESLWHVLRMCALWGAIAGSFSIIQICIPLITRDVSGDDAAKWLGIFMSTTAVCGAIFSVVGGFLSDFVGRMTLMRPWTLYFLFSVLAVVAADHFANLYLILFARTAAISIPTTILLAYFSDFLRDAALVESYAYLSGSFGAANLTATLLCGVLNSLFSRMASLLLALFLSCVSLYIVMRSPAPPAVQDALAKRSDEARQHGKKDAVSLGEFIRSVRLIVADRYLLLICIACSTVRMANMNDHLMLVFFISYRTHGNLSSISYVLGLMAFTMSLSQLVLLPLAARYCCVFRALLLSLLVMFVCIFSMAFCFNLGHFAVVTFFLGASLIAPSIFNARISVLTSASGISGVTLGVVSTLTNTAEVFAAVGYGELLEWAMGSFGESSYWSGAPFMINGTTVALAMLMVIFAECRYGKKCKPWGSEEKRLTGALVVNDDDEWPAAEVPKLGSLFNRKTEVFDATTLAQPPPMAPLKGPAIVLLNPEKSD
ncbi:putative transporter [Leptomonas seymouri]|uniref:Putative transporter n=1 Tax=Leptomonas seymouri TaxID=5684 RepID=A0A0N0P8R2_LEPSE|nr:putative transporter [Leptomonas seymouri]|eukprot:KPI90239.1 putative transporter [Leptomonas seymouri]